MKELFKDEKYHPKQKNRFIVEIGEPWNFPSYVVKAITRPTFGYLGEVKESLKIEFYDPINPSMSYKISDILRQPPYECNEVPLNLKVLGPIGDTVEEFDMVGWFTHFDFGELDWSKDEVLTITGYFEVHKCTHEF